MSGKELVLVFLGGGAGSMLRFLLSKALSPAAGFPYGTWTVNILGSLLIGILMGFVLRQNGLSAGMSLLLVTGFCGGFTTFSTFAYENLAFLRAGDYMSFAAYSLSSLALGIAAVFLGIFLSRG